MRYVMMKFCVIGMMRVCAVSTDQLMDAIAAVESDNGRTSTNVYQLTPVYVRDVNRISRQNLTFAQAIATEEVSRACIEAYWDHYGFEYMKKNGKAPAAEVLARIHNGGPDGWKKPATRYYWRKVRTALIMNCFKSKGGK